MKKLFTIFILALLMVCCAALCLAEEAEAPCQHTAAVRPGVAPGCTSSGLSEGTYCTACGETIKAQTILPPTGHTEVADAPVEPTDVSSGLTAGSHCSACGKVFTAQQVVPARGHTFNAWLPCEDQQHTAQCVTCPTVAKLPCQPFAVTCGEETLQVCPICGSFGDAAFALLLSRRDAALPTGSVLAYGLADPFEGTLYAFTVAGSYGGSLTPFKGEVTVTLPEDLSQLPAFRVVRADVTEEGETLTEIPFTLEEGLLTIVTDAEGLFLLQAAE